MLQLPRWRVILVIIVTVLGFAFTMPNLLSPAQRAHLPTWAPHQALNLGLDLQGGSYLLLEVDVPTLRHQQLDNISGQMANALRRADPTILATGRGIVGDVAHIRLVNPGDMQRAMTALRPVNGQTTQGTQQLTWATQPDGTIEAHLNDDFVREFVRDAAQRSIEVIRKRIDPNGTSEVTIIRQGDQRIVVQAPGVDDPEQLKERIGKTALLTFQLVDENPDPADMAAGRVPIGDALADPYPGVGNQRALVRRHIELSGEHLRNAAAATDQQTGAYELRFDLDSQGDHIFCHLSTQYVGQRFAILLDGQVLTAPTIETPICGGGGRITGSFTAQSASELALMLRAGALPAPLTVIQQSTVGPEIGAAAIEAGSKATMYASIAVVVFMILAYGLFGFLACLALIVNMSMIIGSMSLGGATLTLPGIAGLVLTIGMAVDANVLIYERMREEAANGRGAAMAIDAGFSRAMVTIIDSHVTQLGAALILFAFGAGPVKGFAWTLSIGCVTSVITATFVTQTLIALWFRTLRPKTLPI
jgi:protein-export membrane protein SecD